MTTYTLLVSLIIGLFVAMLFLNVYFRVKVLKSYRILIQNRVDFQAKHLFSKEKMAEEIIPKYPSLEKEISTFQNNVQYSIKMASVLVMLITLFGAVLMWYRNG